MVNSKEWEKYYKYNPELKNLLYKKHHEWYVKNRESERLKSRAWRQQIRLKVLNAYTNNNPACVCCGEKTTEFLTINHINGRGTEHRKTVGAGTPFYSWLIRNGFPKEYNVLCYNCNCAIGHYGTCPHVINKQILVVSF